MDCFSIGHPCTQSPSFRNLDHFDNFIIVRIRSANLFCVCVLFITFSDSTQTLYLFLYRYQCDDRLINQLKIIFLVIQFFAFVVLWQFFITFFGPLAFYLFSPLDLVYRPSSWLFEKQIIVKMYFGLIPQKLISNLAFLNVLKHKPLFCPAIGFVTILLKARHE